MLFVYDTEIVSADPHQCLTEMDLIHLLETVGIPWVRSPRWSRWNSRLLPVSPNKQISPRYVILLGKQLNISVGQLVFTGKTIWKTIWSQILRKKNFPLGDQSSWAKLSSHPVNLRGAAWWNPWVSVTHDRKLI